MISSHFTVHSISQTLFFFTTLFKYFFIFYLFSFFLLQAAITFTTKIPSQQPVPPPQHCCTTTTNPQKPTTTETYTQPQIQLDQKYPPLKHPPPTHNHRNLYSATDPTQLEIPTTGNPKPLR